MKCSKCGLDKKVVKKQGVSFIGSDGTEQDMSVNICKECRDKAEHTLFHCKWFNDGEKCECGLGPTE
jgi:hypothetical protein